jgi:glycine cleavage system H protein
MDEFTYTNIFDTKGIEYLVVIAFLLLIIPFWRLLNKPIKAKVTAMEALGIISENILKIPQGFFYSRNHAWTYLEKSGLAKVGLDDLLAHITGSITVNTSVEKGDRVKKGDLIARIEQNGKQLKITSPISGQIESFNETLFENPEILNKDPYEKGWIAQIKPEDWQMETNAYLLAEDATEWAKNELARIKDFVAVSMKKISPEPSLVVLQEGGELVENPLAKMPKEIWEDFQKEFLD